MRPYVILSYISLLLLAFGVTFIGAVITSFSNRVRPGLTATHLSDISIGTVPPQLFQVSDVLIVVSVAARRGRSSLTRRSSNSSTRQAPL